MLLHVCLEKAQRIFIGIAGRASIPEGNYLVAVVREIEAVRYSVQPSTNPVELVRIGKIPALVLGGHNLKQRRERTVIVSHTGARENVFTQRFVGPTVLKRWRPPLWNQAGLVRTLSPPAWTVTTAVSHIGGRRMHARLHARNTANMLATGSQQRLTGQGLDRHRRRKYRAAFADSLEQCTTPR